MTQISGVLLQLPAQSIVDSTIAGNASIAISKLAKRSLQTFNIPWQDFRQQGSFIANPLGAASGSDLALLTGTFGTNSAKISAGDCKTLTATRKIWTSIAIPDVFEPAGTMYVRVRAAMETTVASTSCTIAVDGRLDGGSGTPGSNLVTTSAQSMNSLTPLNYDFAVNTAALFAGNLLQCMFTIVSTDVATGTAVSPTIYAVQLLCDTRG